MRLSNFQLIGLQKFVVYTLFNYWSHCYLYYTYMHFDDYGDSPVTTVINEHLLFVIFLMINIKCI
jgi:hypothetical protein